MFNLHTFNRKKYFAIYFEYKKEPFLYFSRGEVIEYAVFNVDKPYYSYAMIVDDKNMTWWTI